MSKSELPPMSPDAPVLPVKDLILVRTIDISETEITTPGGIIVPNMSADAKKYEYGEVLACGEGAFSGAYGTRIPMDVFVGDKVAHVEKAGWRFRHGGVEYRVIRELDVWVVLNPERAGRELQVLAALAAQAAE